MKRSKRGRPRKFNNKDIVWQTDVKAYGVIVDWKSDITGHGYYRVISLTRLYGGKMYGPAVWRQSWNLEPTGQRYKRGPVTYRKNLALGERGCSCNCCIHTAIPSGQLREDGTWTWEDRDDV